jgi:hypothetical protein
MLNLKIATAALAEMRDAYFGHQLSESSASS